MPVDSPITSAERKQIEEALRKSEDRFRQIYENAIMGIAITDWDGRFQQCNPAFRRLVGYSEAELHQIEFGRLLEPRERQADLLEIDRLKRGEVSSYETRTRYLHKNGLPVWVHEFVSILPGDRGEPAHIMLLVSDITLTVKAKALVDDLNEALLERTKLAEQRSAELQQLAMELSLAEDRERQRLARFLHDDLQQMLAYLKIQLSILMEEEEKAERHTVEALSDLVGRCIEYCRHLSHEMNPPILKKKDFTSALGWLCRQMQERYGLSVDLQANDDCVIPSLVLSSMLFRSIRELLFNVVKHAGASSASLETRIERERFLVVVRDAGAGCDPEVLKKRQDAEDVFGLFDIQDRIQFLGGSMKIDSCAGRGFEVTLSVPLESLAASEKMPVVPIESNPPQVLPCADEPNVGRFAENPAVTVMIAEDHALMRAGLAKLLQEQEGISVVGTAADGREAMLLAARLNPHVILMDISMPVMNGIAATTEIRRQQPGIKVIGLTINKDPDTLQAMHEAGALACLSKTGSPEALIRQIRLAAAMDPASAIYL